jgi:hypothetical protein
VRIADQHSNGFTRKDIKGVIESVLRFGSRQFCHARAKACFGWNRVETDEAEGAAKFNAPSVVIADALTERAWSAEGMDVPHSRGSCHP